ncbi:hypothetical protein QTP88_019167 [Uroleucon formosanum]
MIRKPYLMSFGNSDGGIFSSSKMGKAFEKNKFNILNVYLMVELYQKQVRFYHTDETKKIFNEQLLRARKVVEDAFGQLSQKFRVYQRRLKSLPENADKIIFTTCILHNFIKSDNENQFVSSMSEQLPRHITNIPNQGGSAPQVAFEVREKFKQFFNLPAGFGTTNDGNTAGRFFSDPQLISQITQVDENLINRFDTKSYVLASGFEINYMTIEQLCTKTAEYCVRLYP